MNNLRQRAIASLIPYHTSGFYCSECNLVNGLNPNIECEHYKIAMTNTDILPPEETDV